MKNKNDLPKKGIMQQIKRRKPSDRDLLKKKRVTGQQGSPSGKQSGKSGWPIGHRIAFILLLVMLGFFMWKQMNSESANFADVTYTVFDAMVKDDIIKEAKLRNGTLTAKFKTDQVIEQDGEKNSFSGMRVEVGVYDREFLSELVEHGINLKIEPERTWMNVLVNTLPWILIFGIWLFFLRQMQGGPKGVFSFGKSRAKLLTENQSKVTFKDVAGVVEAKTELEEIIDFLKDPRKFQRLGGKIPKGALLVGPPGTGKTLLARAVAGEAGVPFFSMSGSDFVEMFVGVGASRVRDLFEQGKSSAPCIIFIDEIDAVGRQRGAGIGGGHDEREQTLNQLLVEMDGFESNEGVILLAATNRPDVLDPALLRPGRFDRQIIVDFPDVKAREQILKVHTDQILSSSRVNLERIAQGTPGMTGADLANVVNEAALLAARLNRKEVTMADFEEAKDKVMMGAERRSMVINENEKRLTACHEAGHVLAGKHAEFTDPVHKVSIIARGRALGQTQFLPSSEKHNWSYNYCIGTLVRLLGGRAAEIIKFNDITNGASNDIENATKLARKMVCEWGMSKRLGPLTFGRKDQEIFLGRDISTQKDYSEETAVAIDQEIRKLVETAQQQAETIIRDNIIQLDALTEALLIHEVIDGPDIDRILNGEDISKKTRRRRRRPSTKRKPSDNRGQKNGDSQRTKDAKPEKTDSEQKASDSSEKITRPPRRRKPRSQQNNKAEASTQSKSADTAQAPQAKSDSGESNDKQNNETKKKSSGSSRSKRDSSSRSKIVRLKTGGRQRFIRKAPAKKIREIN